MTILPAFVCRGGLPSDGPDDASPFADLARHRTRDLATTASLREGCRPDHRTPQLIQRMVEGSQRSRRRTNSLDTEPEPR